jgi:hypothetical protein
MDCNSCRETQRRGEAFICRDCGFASNGPGGDSVIAYHRSGAMRGPAQKREWELTLQDRLGAFGTKLERARSSTSASTDADELLVEGEALLRKYQSEAPTEIVILNGLQGSVAALRKAVSVDCNHRSKHFEEANTLYVKAYRASQKC